MKKRKLTVVTVKAFDQQTKIDRMPSLHYECMTLVVGRAFWNPMAVPSAVKSLD